MLSSLHIKNLAIIDELAIGFAPGLNALTGETGAGKTIIVQALSLILGDRASFDLVRSGADHGSVTAVFNDLSLPQSVIDILSGAGIDFSDELIIHRTIGINGKGKVAINGSPSTAGFLKEIASHLVDISSQHEHQLLLDEGNHSAIIDSFGSLNDLYENYSAANRKFRSLKNELDDLRRDENVAKERLDYLKFQLDELQKAELNPGEDLEIELKRNRFKHAASLEEKARSSEALLYGESGAAAETIGQAIKLIAQASEHDESLKIWIEGLERARDEIESVSQGLSRYAEGLEFDPDELERLDERLHLLRSLIKKHGGSIDECIAKCEQLACDISKIESYDEILESKERELELASKDRRSSAHKLSKARSDTALKLANSVESELGELAMGRTQFAARVEERPEVEWDESGPDRIELLISANVGEAMKPIARIASGGELSRFLLALKAALADRGGMASTSVFDEVDSGIGGGVAEVVGRKLKKLSASRQVICITHLPQVASFADHHMRIEKMLQGERTVVRIGELSQENRVDEIARMLGGVEITKTTRAHAGEMLKKSLS